MICPLLAIKGEEVDELTKLIPTECYEHECAWWDITRKCCSMRSAAESLHATRIHLHELLDIIPKQTQFVARP